MPESTISTLPVRRVKTLSIILFALAIVTVSCGGDGSGTLRVFAASSLTEAFKNIAMAFEAENPGVAVKLDFGGSQRLRSQLEFGAKADVFASADSIQMDLLVAEDLVSGTPAGFASNALVVVAMSNGPVRKISDLAQPGVRVVLGQENVPVGAYSRQVLENLSHEAGLGLGGGFKDDVLANLVSREPNVSFAFQKVALGEVDAGFVYETDMIAALEMGTRDIFFIAIPAAANAVARYTIAVMADTSEPELAQAFVRFVLSETGQSLLEGHGFRSP